MTKFTSLFAAGMLAAAGVFAQAPANDDCDGAIALTVNGNANCGTVLNTTNENATGSAQAAPACSGLLQPYNDVWYSFTATASSQVLQITNADAGSNWWLTLGIAVYSGSCGNMAEIACEDYAYDYFFSPDITPLTASGLTVGETYYVRVWTEDYDEDPTATFSICAGLEPVAPVNDDAANAIALTVGAPCTGAQYSNVLATLNTADGEPFANCSNDSQGEHSVWFSFTAPASGGVKITTDNGTSGTLDDTKIGLFAVEDPADYSSFTLLACDEDNGVDNGTTNNLSTIFATGLTPNTTYYILVDAYDSTQTGTFCVQVEEINPTMLSNSAACADIVTPYGSVTDYTGWVTLVDEAGKLVALVRNPAGGAVNGYSGSYNIDGNGFGMPRQDANGVYYLSRNYMITNTDVTTPVDVRFFFHPGEIATLTGVSGGAATLANLNVTKQESNVCHADFEESNGATSVLLQTANGSVNSTSWIQVSTSSFSNFYLMGGTVPLFVELREISASNQGTSNRIDWTVAREGKGDYFELERSMDGRNFSFLATVQAKGDAAYSYWDKDPAAGNNYYRLKVMNADGKPYYSRVVSAMVNDATAFGLEVFPNPAANRVSVSIAGQRDADAVLTVSDATGRILKTIRAAAASVDIDMSTFSHGLYLIEYRDRTKHTSVRVTKE